MSDERDGQGWEGIIFVPTGQSIGAGTPVAGGRTVYVGPEPAAITLQAVPSEDYHDGAAPRRTAPQMERLPRPALPAADLIFGADLTWPLRGFLVNPPHSDTPADGAGAPLGTWPPQPVARPSSPVEMAQRLCLFNVIVALEWRPDERSLLRLSWAFRRASDFLYDVTDGTMALGQVIIGGPEWLDGADIQVLASTRLHPRSWTNGLHDAAKFMPIRAGRGVWSKAARRVIPWDEPEAYRTLVHEWAHYALGLKDEYLTSVGVQPTLGYGPRLVRAAGSARSLVIPRVSPPIRSIMATQQGTSELMAHRTDRRPRGGGSYRTDEWDHLRAKPEFAFLRLEADHTPSDGPWTLPLPLPTFHSLLEPTPADDGPLALGDLPAGLARDHCWTYVVKGPLDRPTAIVAQGTLEARGEATLLGAATGDTVVLVGDTGGRPGVWRGRLERLADGPPTIAHWEEATPEAFPLVDVVPRAVEATEQRQPVDVVVRVTGTGGAAPDSVWLFPVGPASGETRLMAAATGEDGAWLSQPHPARTLDGHILVTWDGGQRLVIASFSQGGGPASTGGVSENPTAAGSSEGNLMLFFRDADGGGDYGYLRVVTTHIPGGPGRLPGVRPVEAARAHSYAFSLASNAPLPTTLNPTLILFHDPVAEQEDGDLRVYRSLGRDRWSVLPTYLDLGAALAATPLADPIVGGSLVTAAPGADGLRVERYRLFWSRREAVME